MAGYLAALGRKVERVADVGEPEISSVNIAELVGAAIAEHEAMAQMYDADVEVMDLDECTVLAAETLVTEVLSELIANALEVPRPDGRRGVVSISTSHTNEFGVVRVADNGIGLPDLLIPDRIEDIRSRSGRPPEGLATIAIAMSISRGAVEVLETSNSGTVFEIRVPRLLRTVASGVE